MIKLIKMVKKFIKTDQCEKRTAFFYCLNLILCVVLILDHFKLDFQIILAANF